MWHHGTLPGAEGYGPILSRHAGEDDIAPGRLVQLFDIDIKHDYAYSIIEPASGIARRTDALDTFKDWLLSTAKGK